MITLPLKRRAELFQEKHPEVKVKHFTGSGIYIECETHGKVVISWIHVDTLKKGCKFCVSCTPVKDSCRFYPKMGFEGFLKRVKNAHGDLFIIDPEKNKDFLNSNSIVVITCKEHGDFSTKASNIMYKSGGGNCPACSPRGNLDLRLKIIQKKFPDVQFTKRKHKSSTNFSIKCDFHGEVIYSVKDLDAFNGICKLCREDSTHHVNPFLTLKSAELWLKTTFGDKYSLIYEQNKRLYRKDKITIKCPDHGEIERSVNYLSTVKSKSGEKYRGHGFICSKCEDPYTEGGHWGYTISCEDGFLIRTTHGVTKKITPVLNSDSTPVKCGEKRY